MILAGKGGGYPSRVLKWKVWGRGGSVTIKSKMQYSVVVYRAGEFEWWSVLKTLDTVLRRRRCTPIRVERGVGC